MVSKTKVGFFSILVVMGFILLKLQGAPDLNSKKTSKPAPPPPVKVKTLQLQDNQITKVRYGKLSAGNYATYTSKYAVEVAKIFIKDGDKVASLAKLVNLGSRDLQIELEQLYKEEKFMHQKMDLNRKIMLAEVHNESLLNQQVYLATNEYNRSKKLAKGGYVSQQEVDTVHSKLLGLKQSLNNANRTITTMQSAYNDIQNATSSLQSKMAQLENRLIDYRLQARFPGIITNLNVKNGQQLQPGQHILDIFDPNSMEVNINGIMLNDTPFSIDVAGTSTQIGDNNIPATATAIATMIEPGKFAPGITIKLRYAANMVIGETYKTTFTLTIASSLSIPAEFVYDRTNIYVQNDNYELVYVPVKVLGSDSNNKANVIVVPEDKLPSYQVVYNNYLNSRDNVVRDSRAAE